MVTIKGFTPRLYQETILATAVMNNSLVVLPTGMGKSIVFVMLAVQRLSSYPKSKILILAPTKPLCEQHMQSCRKHIDIDPDKVVLLTGQVKPEKRVEMWDDARIIVSTPQGLENDVINRKINLQDISLLVVDECHRAVKGYSYVWIAKQYEQLARYPRILALTASPGTDMESITELCKNLFIENIELRTEHDPDMKQYIQDVKISWIDVILPDEFRKVQRYLKDCFKSKIKDIKASGVVADINDNCSKKALLDLQASLHGEIASGNRSFDILRSISLAAESMKVQHGLELLESQGTIALNIYLDKIMNDARTTTVKATKNLAADINFRSAWILAQAMKEKKIEHPKLEKLGQIVVEDISNIKDAKIIVFNQYRDNAENIAAELNNLNGVEARLFVGQQKRGTTGLSQKKQIQMLNDFREGKFNVLVATSVAEEGLDIPKVDSVIFYEPIPSAIRHIQRRGRTGRLERGEVRILVTKGTRDEVYRWSAHHKEKRMYRTLDSLRKKIHIHLQNVKKEKENDKKQKKLAGYGASPGRSKNLIIIDHREKSSSIVKELIDLGNNVKIEQLDSADYLCSERVGIEYKKKEDFINSIIDGRMLEQAKNLKNSFERPIVIVEGDEDLYSIRKIHPNAVQGMIAAITVSFGIPIIYTKHNKETASILSVIASREQQGEQKYFSPHASNKPMDIKQIQEYIVSSLPSIGPLLAKEMLAHFGSVSGVFNASEVELKKVSKVGDKKSVGVREIIDRKYLCE